MAQSANLEPRPAAATLEGMTARWSDPGRLSVPPTGYVRAVNLSETAR